MPDAYTCPHCGARITPFAAGCAYCGTDLDRYRRNRRPPTVHRLRTRLRIRRHAEHRPRS